MSQTILKLPTQRKRTTPNPVRLEAIWLVLHCFMFLVLAIGFIIMAFQGFCNIVLGLYAWVCMYFWYPICVRTFRNFGKLNVVSYSHRYIWLDIVSLILVVVFIMLWYNIGAKLFVPYYLLGYLIKQSHRHPFLNPNTL